MSTQKIVVHLSLNRRRETNRILGDMEAKRKGVLLELAKEINSITGMKILNHMHVCKLDPNLKEDQIIEHLRENGFQDVRCIKMESKRPEEYSSFRILAQRIQSGKLRNGIRKQASEASINPDEEHLKIPPEEPKPTNPYDVGYI
ncbi:hypothetical protein HHI36_013269 [Cryptolaemus montrouzieri]|uniref:Uncharacterized protein n=1 Tax=Cryptolaemus montrouzieri TaxID=559131 RepID=A0ABD2NGY7_9CUCU